MASDEDAVLVTTVEIAPGFSRSIRLQRGDCAWSRALDFCAEFCLSEDVAAPLASHLQENLDKATVCSRLATVLLTRLDDFYLFDTVIHSVVCMEQRAGYMFRALQLS